MYNDLHCVGYRFYSRGIKSELRFRRLSQKHVAAKTGASLYAVSRALNGKGDFWVLPRIKEVFLSDCSWHDLRVF